MQRNDRLGQAKQALAAVIVLSVGPATGIPKAHAQEVGNVQRGHAAARVLCADCHGVEPDAARSPDPKAPTFEKVAHIKGMTRLALSVWLHSSHPTMPMLKLEPETTEDLSAYIVSLRETSNAKQ